jgi:2-methylcitrate dehydratase PrpD
MGAAAGVARLLGLPATQTESALGIAEFYAPLTPVMRSVRHPAMAKDGTAWGAMVGTSAALLAGQGYTASPSLLGEREFRQAMSSLGEEYTILKLYFKPYPCCRWAQPSIEAVLRLKHQHKLQTEAITRITIHTFPEAAALSRKPPSNWEQAEYNICYPVAAAAALGDFGPAHLAQASFHNPQVLAMMDRIHVVIDPDIARQFPQKCLSEVEIATAAGGVYRSGAITARGDWDNPLSLNEMEEKFLRITGPVLPLTDARRLLELIQSFEKRTVADIIPFLR